MLPAAVFKYDCGVHDWAPLTAGQLFEVCQAEVLFAQVCNHADHVVIQGISLPFYNDACVSLFPGYSS